MTPTSIRKFVKHLLFVRETWVKKHGEKTVDGEEIVDGERFYEAEEDLDVTRCNITASN